MTNEEKTQAVEAALDYGLTIPMVRNAQQRMLGYIWGHSGPLPSMEAEVLAHARDFLGKALLAKILEEEDAKFESDISYRVEYARKFYGVRP